MLRPRGPQLALAEEAEGVAMEVVAAAVVEEGEFINRLDMHISCERQVSCIIIDILTK